MQTKMARAIGASVALMRLFMFVSTATIDHGGTANDSDFPSQPSLSRSAWADDFMLAKGG